MEIALAFGYLGVIIFKLAYFYNMGRQVVSILSAKIPDISIYEWKVRFSFAVILFQGLCCILGEDNWGNWVLWIFLFVTNVNLLKRFTK